MTDEWKSTDAGLDWKDGGKAEFRRKDGTVVIGEFYPECGSDGEGGEYPYGGPVYLEDGSEESFYDFEAWRLI